MGFVREPASDHLTLETRRESFKIHAKYSWGPDGGQHIEIEYADLPALIRELHAIVAEQISDGTLKPEA